MSFEPSECLSIKTEAAYALIVAAVKELNRLSFLQRGIFKLIEAPQLKVLNREVAETGRDLENLGLVEKAVQFESYLRKINESGKCGSFLTAPGSRMNDHHAFPGGLVMHVAADLEHALATAAVYQKIYGVDVDRDLLVTALVLHDIAKPSLFPWNDRGTYPDEIVIAGTSGHHVISVAELIYRGFSFPVVKAAAFCHVTTLSPERDLEKFLTAAYLIAGKEAPQRQLWRITLEDWICMYADSDGNVIGWVRRQLAKDQRLNRLEPLEFYKLLAAGSEWGLYNDNHNYINNESI